ncbi:MAG: branched-chain-amino-acid transaminase [Spirochaetales bacterium]|nr:branched-chain-amino-acid transaminase [Spirochaetales bacterium]
MVYVNGTFTENDKAMISVYDHGLLYGDGVFEGIRFYNKNAFLLDRHIDRLIASCKGILLDPPEPGKRITALVNETIEKSGLVNGYIRLLVTRGPGKLGISPYICTGPGLIIIVDLITLFPDEFYTKGIALMTSSYRRTPLDSLDTRIKSLNYLNNVLAKAEAVNAGYLETIILNRDGRVAECTGDNIFVVRHNTLYTPDVTEGALDGITRRFVLDYCTENGIRCAENRLSLYDLYNADECFLTGTAAEIMPVIEVNKRMIGDGKPGPMTAKILNAYRSAAGK